MECFYFKPNYIFLYLESEGSGLVENLKEQRVFLSTFYFLLLLFLVKVVRVISSRQYVLMHCYMPLLEFEFLLQVWIHSIVVQASL